MSLAKHKSLNLIKGLVKFKGLVKSKGLIKAIGSFFWYYQWLKLGLNDDVTNSGIGGSLVDASVISGSMAGQDLVIRQPSGDSGLFALSEAYSLGWYGVDKDDPLDITYAQLKAYLTYSSRIITDTNTVSELFLNNTNQRLFKNTPIQIGSKYGFVDESGTLINNVNIIALGDSITSQNDYIGKLITLLEAEFTDVTFTGLNSGVGGATMISLLTNYDTLVNDKIDPEAINIVLVNEFINDTDTAYDEQQANDYMKLIDEMADNDNALVYVCTSPVCSAPYFTYPKNASAILRAVNAFAYGFIDWEISANLTDPTNLTYRQADGVHMTDAGTQAMAQSSFDVVKLDIENIIDSQSKYVNAAIITKNQTAYFKDAYSEIVTTKPGTNDFNFGVEWLGELGGDSYGGMIQLGMSTSADAKGIGLFRLSTGTNAVSLFVATQAGGAFLVNTAIGTLSSLYNKIEVFREGDNIRTVVDTIGTDLIPTHQEFNDTIDVNYDFTPSKNWRIGGDNNEGGFMNRCEFNILRTWFNSTNDVFEYNMNHQNGNYLYDSSTGGHDVVINNPNADIWDFTSDDYVIPVHLIDGCSIWVNGSDYIVAPLNSTVSQGGYSLVGRFSAGDGILIGLINEYLGILYSDWKTNEKTFTEIKALEDVIPPKENFRIDNEGDVIKNMVSEPFEPFYDANGDIVFVDGKQLYVIKNF